MIIVNNYFIAILLCFLAMVCWGSWQNTRNIAGTSWRFELFYWDFSIGIVLFSLLAALTIGSLGSEGRSFIADIKQATSINIGSAMLGGVIWNMGTLLLTAAIAISGMSVAFPVGGGIGWILGIAINYFANPAGNPFYLLVGSIIIIIAILFSMISYKKLATQQKKSTVKGFLLAFTAGLLIAFFYRFVAFSLAMDNTTEVVGKLTPYTAVFFFSIGAFICTLIVNPLFMKNPIEGSKVSFADYKSGTFKKHIMGIVGGMIWCTGMVASFMSVNAASPAISYGLSNAAPVIAASWGVFIWKEFKDAPKGTNLYLSLMFLCYMIGLVLIVLSKLN